MTNWENNSIQFPRLLSEMYANLDFTEDQWNLLCQSMDLTKNEILNIMVRADDEWQKIKDNT